MLLLFFYTIYIHFFPLKTFLLFLRKGGRGSWCPRNWCWGQLLRFFLLFFVILGGDFLFYFISEMDSFSPTSVMILVGYLCANRVGGIQMTGAWILRSLLLAGMKMLGIFWSRPVTCRVVCHRIIASFTRFSRAIVWKVWRQLNKKILGLVLLKMGVLLMDFQSCVYSSNFGVVAIVPLESIVNIHKKCQNNI